MTVIDKNYRPLENLIGGQRIRPVFKLYRREKVLPRLALWAKSSAYRNSCFCHDGICLFPGSCFSGEGSFPARPGIGETLVFFFPVAVESIRVQPDRCLFVPRLFQAAVETGDCRRPRSIPAGGVEVAGQIKFHQPFFCGAVIWVITGRGWIRRALRCLPCPSRGGGFLFGPPGDPGRTK